MQLILDFNDEATAEQIAAFISANNLTDVVELSAAQKCYLVTSNTLLASTSEVTITRNDQSPLTLLTYPQLTFDTNEASNWWKLASFVKPDFEAVNQTYDRRGANATIYLVDSGVNTTHIEFANANVSGLYTFNGNLADTNGHGTALASVMVGTTCGLTNATIKSVKIFENGFDTLQSHFVSAIDAIITDVINNPLGLKIVNMSWSIAKNPYIESKIQLLVDAGVKVVVAAGNSGIPIENVTPASMASVFTVGAYSQELVPCDFSNYTGLISTTPGETNYGEIDVWAPGADIPAVVSFAQISNISGTSVASAIQAAAFAYNSDSNILSDGSLPSAINPMSNLGSFSDKGILTLNGFYANNTKKTAVYRGDYDGDNGLFYRTISNFNIVARSGEQISKNPAPFYIVESFNIQNPLPAGLTYDNGWIEGIIGDANTTETFFWESPVTYTKHDGLVKNSVMRVAILPSSVDINSLPQEDPAVKITLLACGKVFSSGNGLWYCNGQCFGSDFCHDVCDNPKPTEPDQIQCTCSPHVNCD